MSRTQPSGCSGEHRRTPLAGRRQVPSIDVFVLGAGFLGHGYRCIIARVSAGDAAWIDAMVDRVADILATTHGADHNHDGVEIYWSQVQLE